MPIFTPVAKLSDHEIKAVLRRTSSQDLFDSVRTFKRKPIMGGLLRAVNARRVRIISAGLSSSNEETCALALQSLDSLDTRHPSDAFNNAPAETRDVLFLQTLDILLHGGSERQRELALNIVRKWNKSGTLPHRDYDDGLRRVGMFFRHANAHLDGSGGVNENYNNYIWQENSGALFYKGGCLKTHDIREAARRRLKAELADTKSDYRMHRINTKLPDLIRGVTLLADIDIGNAREHAGILHAIVNDPASRLEPKWFERFQPLVDDLARAAKGEKIENPPTPLNYPDKARALGMLANSKAIFG